MEAMFWVACVVGLLLVAMNAVPALLRKTAGQKLPVVVHDVPDAPTQVNTEQQDRRTTFDRLMLLQSLLEEFNVPVEQQCAVVEPLVLRLLPCTTKAKE